MSLKTAIYQYNDAGHEKTGFQKITNLSLDWKTFEASVAAEEFPSEEESQTGVPPVRRTSVFPFDLSDPEILDLAIRLSVKIWEKHRQAKCIPHWEKDELGKREIVMKSIDDLGGQINDVDLKKLGGKGK